MERNRNSICEYWESASFRSQRMSRIVELILSIEFEWDEQKRLSNLEKHGIDFVRACQIFDSYTVEFEDNRYDYGEDRYIAIGETNGQLLTVIYTYFNRNLHLSK